MSLEYNPSGGAGIGNAGTELDGINLLAKLLSSLVTIETVNSLPSGAATETTLAALLAKVISAPATEAKQDLILERLVADTWTTIPGNSITMTYYGGVVAGNPSGALTNAETAVYSDSGGPVFTQTFTYDINNNILTIVVS